MFKIKTLSLNLLSIIFFMSSSNLLLSSDNGSSSSSSSSSTSSNPKDKAPVAKKHKSFMDSFAANSNQDELSPPCSQNSKQEKVPKNWVERVNHDLSTSTNKTEQEGWFQAGVDKGTRNLIRDLAPTAENIVATATKNGLKATFGLDEETCQTINNACENGLKASLSLNEQTCKAINNASENGLKHHSTLGLDERTLETLNSIPHAICILFASIACTTIGSMLIYKNSKIEKLKSSKTALLATGVSLIACGIAIPCLFLKGSTPPAQQ